jgi:hypothetical protein
MWEQKYRDHGKKWLKNKTKLVQRNKSNLNAEQNSILLGKYKARETKHDNKRNTTNMKEQIELNTKENYKMWGTKIY